MKGLVDEPTLPNAGHTLPNAFTGVTDAPYLRATIDALSGLIQEVNQDPELTAEFAGLDRPRVDGMRAVKALALRRKNWALAQLHTLRPTTGDVRPVVLDPAHLAGAGLSRQGQPLTPVITAEVAPTHGLSSAQVWMPPQHTSLAHVHHHTGVGVLVPQGTAITLWWDENGELHELPQLAGQHLFIPSGIAHAAINPHQVPVIAAEFRDNPIFQADNELLPDLDAQVQAAMDVAATMRPTAEPSIAHRRRVDPARAGER